MGVIPSDETRIRRQIDNDLAASATEAPARGCVTRRHRYVTDRTT